VGHVVTQRVLHMIGNAHIDPVWLWQWPEGYQEVRATFSSALDRMDEYPDFVFTSNSMLFFAWIEEHDPQLFERIRARVAEGRWQVVGGWWLEPDCNIPSGESLVRHALYGQRYLKEKFDLTATTGANFDSFGHNATIPQLLRKSGMDSYVFLRPGVNEKQLPGPVFWWQSPDGSRVLAYRIPHEYGSPPGGLGVQVEKALEQVPADEAELMIFYGVGNHGGGPTKENLDSIARIDGADCSSARAFFDSVNGRELPVVEGELLHHSPGCYSAHSEIKRSNRRVENLLQRAEKWCAVAERVAGQPYPHHELREAWKLLLFNQFHDTLAGTAIKPAYEDARDQLGYSAAGAALAFNRAVQAVARQIEIPFEEGTQPVVVFNPHLWPVTVDAEVEIAGYRDQAPRLVDEGGNEVPIQRTRSYATVTSSRGRIVFRAELPALGYRTYRLSPGGENSGSFPGPLELEDVIPDGRRAVVVRDESDTWGHGVHAYDDEIGEFEDTSAHVVEDGPVRKVIRVESAYASSTLVEEYVLSAGASYVDVRVRVDWREQLKLLKLRYPTRGGDATYEIPYGHVVRAANGDENPAQNWVDCGGLSVATDAKYGHDVRDGSIGVTALRSPVYAWHHPRQLDEDGIYDYLDQGPQEFRLRLIPHGGDWRDADTVRLAAELNQPAFALLESAHAGTLPPTASFGEVKSAVGSVLKRAEDGDELVLRAYESAGRPTKASITLFDGTFETDFGAGEIKTFIGAAETDLLEW
jgi:alpha-mannosidase